MSWVDIRPYFKTQLETESLSEWSDAFNTNNIPNDIIDGAYNIQFGDFIGRGINQHTQETTTQVMVRIYKKGYADTQTIYDESVLLSETLVKKICKTANRLNSTFKNIEFIKMDLLPIGESNDNIILIDMEFTVRDFLDVHN